MTPSIDILRNEMVAAMCNEIVVLEDLIVELRKRIVVLEKAVAQTPVPAKDTFSLVLDAAHAFHAANPHVGKLS